MGLALCHLELREANAFIALHHRHHERIQGHRFSLGAVETDCITPPSASRLVGVIVVGRPVGGQHQMDWTEVTRCCTDGTRNACSFLYGAAARASRDLGFTRIQTYILAAETGVSLKACGWQFERLSHPLGWYHGPAAGEADMIDGPRAAREVADHLQGRKQLWFRNLAGNVVLERVAEAEPLAAMADLFAGL